MHAAIAVLLSAALVAQAPARPRRAPRPKPPAAAPGADTPAPPEVEAAPDLPPGEQFERGRIAFGRGEYQQAVDLLRPLLYPEIRLESEGEVVQSHRMLAVAHLFVGQREPAREEFIRLLELRPDYRFDPLLDPPLVVDFFGAILRDREAQITALEARRREAERAERERRQRLLELAQPRVVETRYARNSYLVNFIPLGAGQFQNGQRAKGWAFLLTESALALTSAATFSANFALYGLKPTRKCLQASSGPCMEFDRSQEDTSATLRNVALVSGGLFYAVAAWGIVDALVHYRPLTQLETIERASPRRAPEARLSLHPLLSGDTVGTGLQLRF